MNDISKLLCAAALVALGLGFAFLCGPPGDMPEVIHDSNGAGLLNATATSPLPLRLHAKALSRTEMHAGGHGSHEAIGSESGGVILSAAVADPIREPPAYEPTQVNSSDAWVPLPCPVEIDTYASPLVATSRSSAVEANDKWLLSPPAIPRSYNSQPGIADASSSLTSAHSAASSSSTDTSAWWTQDTPRLQGLSASPSPPEVDQLKHNLVPIQTTPSPSAEPMNSLSTPIVFSDPPAKEAAAIREHTPEARAPVNSYRIHKIADGDTLTRLAERYLRDPNRAREILDLNRDLLTNPDLLPIGTSLRIPGVSNHDEFDSEVSTSGNRMVPVAVAPHTVEVQPRAQLQGPTPLAANSW